MDDKVDKLPGELAGGLAKVEGQLNSPNETAPIPVFNQDNADEMQGTLANAARSLTSAGMKPEDIDPSFSDIVGAEFRQNNTVGSVTSSKSLAERFDPTPDSKPLTHADVIRKVEDGNLQQYFDYFKGARTDAEFDAIKADLEREQHDQAIQAASGWTGFGVGFAAGAIDVPTLLPGGIALRGLKAPALLKAAIETGLGGAAAGTAAEGAFQESQVTRTPGDAVATIGSATLLGAVIGGGVHALVGRKAGDAIVNRLDQVRADAAKGYPQARSAGAAVSGDIYDQAAERTLNGDDRLFAGGAFTSLEKLGDIPVLGEYLRNPRIDAARSPSLVVRQILDSLTDNAAITRKNVEGKASVDSAEAKFGALYEGNFAQAKREMDDLYTQNKGAYKDRGEFNTRVAKALANGEQFDDPTIVAAAKVARERVLKPIKDALVRANVFQDDPVLKNAIDYFPIIYDGEAIKAQKDDFIDWHAGRFAADYSAEAHNALAAKNALSNNIESAKLRTFGFTHKSPKVDETGVPVINPKTGRQVLETQVLRPGSIREASDALKAEADQELARNAAEKKNAELLFDNGQDAQTPHTYLSDNAGEIAADHTATFNERNKIEDARIATEAHRSDALLEAQKELDRKEDVIRKEFNTEGIDALSERNATEKELDAKIAAINKVRSAERTAAQQKQLVSLEKKKTKLAADHAKFEIAHTKARDAKLKAAKKEISAQKETIDAAVKKEFAKLDARLKEARSKIAETHAKIDEAIHEDHTARFAAAQEKALEDFNIDKGDGLESDHASTLRKYVRGGKLDENAIEIEARNAAEHLYTSVTGRDRFTMSHEVQNGTRGYTKARQNPAYHTDLIDKGWVTGDAMEALEKYTKTAGADAALGERFKKEVPTGEKDANGKDITELVGEPSMKTALKKVEEDYKNMLSNVQVPKKLADRLRTKFQNDPAALEVAMNNARRDAETQLTRQGARDIKNLETLRDFIRGTSSATQTPQALHKVAELFGIFNFVTKMGGVVLSSLGDPINVMLAQGFGNAAKYGLVPMLNEFRSAYLNSNGELRTLARLSLANAEMEHGGRMAALGDLGNVYSSRDPMATSRRISEAFGKFSGITYWNSFVKQVAYNTTQARMVIAATKGFENLSKAEQAWMANLGIDAGRAAKIAAEYGAQGEKTVASIPIAKWDEWADKDTAYHFRQAMYRESFNNIIAPKVTDRLAMSASPVGRMILQFRNFMIANQMRLVGRNIQLATLDKTHAANVYTGLFGLVLMSAGIDAMKRFVSNSDVEGSLSDENEFQKYMDDWHNKPGQQLYNALDRAGHFGVLFEGSNIAEKLGLPSIQGGMRFATGEDSDPVNGTSRTKDVDVFGAAFGPTAGALSDIAHAGGVATKFLGHEAHQLKAKFTGNDGEFEAPYEFSRADWKRVQRVVPGSTHPIVRGVLNTGQRYVGNVLDWPAPH